MTPEQIRAAVALIRRAPLQNMGEAEAAAQIIQALLAMLREQPATLPPKGKRK